MAYVSTQIRLGLIEHGSGGMEDPQHKKCLDDGQD